MHTRRNIEGLFEMKKAIVLLEKLYVNITKA